MRGFSSIMYLSLLGAGLVMSALCAGQELVPAGAASMLNNTVTGDQHGVRVHANTSGAQAFAWISEAQDGLNGGVVLKTLGADGVAGGAAGSGELVLTGGDAGDQQAVDIFLQDDGALVAVWMSDQNGTWDVFAQGLTASGGAWFGPSCLHSATAGHQRFPRIGGTPSGELRVVWESEGEIASVEISSGSIVAGSELQINSLTAGAQLYPTVAVNSDGDAIITWQSDETGGDFDVMARRLDADTGLGADEFLVHTPDAGHQIEPAIASVSVETFVLAWSTEDAIKFVTLASEGTAIGTETSATIVGAYAYRAPALCAVADTAFILAWTQYGGPPFSAQIHGMWQTLDGTILDDKTLSVANNQLQMRADLAYRPANHNFTICWQDGFTATTHGSGTTDGSGFGAAMRMVSTCGDLSDIDNDGVPACVDLCEDLTACNFAADPSESCSYPPTWYADADGDGAGDPSVILVQCVAPEGYLALADDGCPADPLKVEPGICGCGISDLDSDLDGTADCNDGCPDDPLKVAPGTCGCGTPDTDSDLDGTADCNDGCPLDPLKTEAGFCGCGTPDTDTDQDGTADCNDGCPLDPLKTAPGICGCGITDLDTDLDGTADCNDGCPNDPLKAEGGICGCGITDLDTDLDGTADCNDGCPNDPLKTEAGTCGCGIPDTDTDFDGTANCIDNCPEDPVKTEPGDCGCGTPDTDTDLDGTADCIDNCPVDPLKIEPGTCGCGVIELDVDNDGLCDSEDLCTEVAAINYNASPTEVCLFDCALMDPPFLFNGLSVIQAASAHAAPDAVIGVEFAGGFPPISLLLTDISAVIPIQNLPVSTAQAPGALPGMFDAIIVDRYGCEGRAASGAGFEPVSREIVVPYTICED